MPGLLGAGVGADAQPTVIRETQPSSRGTSVRRTTGPFGFAARMWTRFGPRSPLMFFWAETEAKRGTGRSQPHNERGSVTWCLPVP